MNTSESRMLGSRIQGEEDARMPARIVIGVWAFVAAFFHLKPTENKSAEMDQRVIDAFDKSYESWVAKGWVPPR